MSDVGNQNQYLPGDGIVSNPLTDTATTQISPNNNEEHGFENSNINSLQDVLSNSTTAQQHQLDNVSNMADDSDCFVPEHLEIPELGKVNSQQPKMFTKALHHSSNTNSKNDEEDQSPTQNQKHHAIVTTHSLFSKWNNKKVSLCCGGKIGMVPCLSVGAILLSILALISIALLVEQPYEEMKKLPIIELMLGRAVLYGSYIAMRDTITLSVVNKESEDPLAVFFAVFYYEYRDSFNQSFTNFTQMIPPGFSHEFLTRSPMLESFPIFTEHWERMAEKVVSVREIDGNVELYVNSTLQEEARMQLYTPLYEQHFNEFQDSFYGLQQKLFEMCNNADHLVKNSTIATLVLICFSLTVILPTILIVFIFALRRDKANERNLHTANRFMLKDTMSNPTIRLDFKKFCKECKMEIPFLILEKIQYYKEYSLESYDLQMKLYEITHELVRKQNIDKNDKNSMLVFIVAQEAEKKLFYFERLKYETAFEIVENFHEDSNAALNSSITSLILETRRVLDLYNNRDDIFEDTDLLPSKLFDPTERQLSQLLAATHLAFKSTSGLNVSKMLNSSVGVAGVVSAEEVELSQV